MRPRIPTGSVMLDSFLEGGLPPGNIILIYGGAETGKTTLAIQCAVNAARMGRKTIFADSDNAFSPERLSQIAPGDLEDVSASIILIRPLSFMDQGVVIDQLEKYLTEKFILVAVDTITSLYRSELGDTKETFTLNRELNRQVATLAQIAKAHDISVLLTSQVRSVVEADMVEVAPVATRVLKFWSNFVISLEATGERNMILARVEKPKKRGLKCRLLIEEDGIHDYVR